MNDTTPEAAAAFDALLRQRSGSDRVRMMSDMFEMARALAVANIKARQPDIGEADLRVEVFKHFYRSDFAPDELDRLGEQLRTRVRSCAADDRPTPDDGG